MADANQQPVAYPLLCALFKIDLQHPNLGLLCWLQSCGTGDGTHPSLGRPKRRFRLVEKVRHGSSDVWGEVPKMPHPADKIGDDDLKAVIGWVLALE